MIHIPLTIIQVGESTSTSHGEDNTKAKLGTSIELNLCNITTKDQGKKKEAKPIFTLAILMTQQVQGPPPPLQIELTPKEEEFEVVNLTVEQSTVVLKKLPPKFKNLDYFSILCIWATLILRKHRLADRTITHPYDIVEDMEANNIVPIILCRPFSAIGRVVIYVEKDELTLRLDRIKSPRPLYLVIVCKILTTVIEQSWTTIKKALLWKPKKP
ncbi:hypothetical protein CR513_01867, partial [Mucuna pruriens]